LDENARVALARPLGEFLRTLHGIALDAGLPSDPVRRTDMTFRVPRTRERLAELEQLGLWQAPRLEVSVNERRGLQRGDDVGRAAAVIDWIDLSYNNPAVDLVLYWSFLPPAGRIEFREVYGTITDDHLLCAFVLALYLCGTLAIDAHREEMPALKREALDGLNRTIRSD
jgi:hypothetical protein